MMSDLTPAKIKATQDALNIVASVKFDAGTADDPEARLTEHLGTIEGANNIASGAINLSVLLLRYFEQTQEQFRDMMAAVLDGQNPDRTDRPEDLLIKSPQQILKFISDQLSTLA